eukprot:gene6225-44756_t
MQAKGASGGGADSPPALIGRPQGSEGSPVSDHDILDTDLSMDDVVGMDDDEGRIEWEQTRPMAASFPLT